MTSKQKQIENRTLKEALLLVETHCTVRQLAKAMGVSKSTVHRDLTRNLPNINYSLYQKTQKILEQHKAVRHLRGGMATRRKWLNINKN